MKDYIKLCCILFLIESCGGIKLNCSITFGFCLYAEELIVLYMGLANLGDHVVNFLKVLEIPSTKAQKLFSDVLCQQTNFRTDAAL